MSNPNLTGALRASLEQIDSGAEPINSPLSEATPDSTDLFLSRINEDMAAGLPEKITDDRLRRLVDLYRAQALQWEQQEQAPKTRKTTSGSKPKTIAEVLNIQI